VARADVIRAETELAGERLELLRAQTAEQAAIALLINAMGMTPGTALDVVEAGDLGKAQHVLPDLQIATGTALAHRPECLRAEAAIGAAEAGVRGAKAGRKPQLSAYGEVGIGDAVFPPRRPVWRAGIEVSVPLFDGGDTRGKVNEARADLGSLRADAEEVRQRVALEVTGATLGVTEAQQAMVVAAEHVRLARHNMELATGRYGTGVGSSIEVKDARLALSEALSGEVRARFRSGTALAELSAAMGLSFWEGRTSP